MMDGHGRLIGDDLARRRAAPSRSRAGLISFLNDRPTRPADSSREYRTSFRIAVIPYHHRARNGREERRNERVRPSLCGRLRDLPLISFYSYSRVLPLLLPPPTLLLWKMSQNNSAPPSLLPKNRCIGITSSGNGAA